MKITKQEKTVFDKIVKNIDKINKLSNVIDNSTYTRKALCDTIANMFLILYDYNYEITEEQIYRMINFYEYAQENKKLPPIEE